MTNREIDALIAEKVMAARKSNDPPGSMDWFPLAYSADPAASKQLEEKLLALGFTITIWMAPGVPHSCKIGTPDGRAFKADGATKEMAGCLAALRAVGVEVPDALLDHIAAREEAAADTGRLDWILENRAIVIDGSVYAHCDWKSGHAVVFGGRTPQAATLSRGRRKAIDQATAEVISRAPE